MSRQLHIVCGGRGGTGKTLIAWLLMQYLEDNGWDPLAVDADVCSATLSSFAALRTRQLAAEDDLLTCMQEICTDHPGAVVLDLGSVRYLQVGELLAAVAALPEDTILQIMVHMSICGMELHCETMAQFMAVRQLLQDCGRPCIQVAWVNPWWGQLREAQEQELLGVMTPGMATLALPDLHGGMQEALLHRVLERRRLLTDDVSETARGLLPGWMLPGVQLGALRRRLWRSLRLLDEVLR